MKVIDKSEFRDENGDITLENRVRGTLRHGLPWYGVMQAQVTASDRLGKSLTNEYTLLRNILLPGTGLIASMILIGPQGVRAITASPIGGVFRAKADDWLAQTSGGFRKSHPNLQQIAVNTAEVVLKYLREQGFGLQEVEPVLLFTNPRAHVDAAHPRARVVLADAVEHFAANIAQMPVVMDAEDVKVVVDAILHPKMAEPEPLPPAPAPRTPGPTLRPAAGAPAAHASPFPEAAPVAGPSAFRLSERPVISRRRPPRLRLTGRQWVLLGLLLAAEVLVVGVFAVIIYLNALGA
jgi:hypothetical protein